MSVDLETLATVVGEPLARTLTRDGYTEAAAVALTLGKMPPIKTVGKIWYAYRDGAWRTTTRDQYRPVVLTVLDEKIQTGRKVVEVLDHIESLHQVLDSELESFYKLDANGVLLNVVNGIVKIEAGSTVALAAHDQTLNFTSQLEASYDPEAHCPCFERVLGEALPDADDRLLLQLFAGSLLLPSCKFEASLVCYGPGGTGKSTIAEAVASVFGAELVERIGMTNICDPKGYYLPKLKRVAINLGTELDALEVGESGNFKALVSGENIAVRPIYGAPFTMTTTAKLWFLSNNLPRFKHGTDAEQRRTRFLRFDKTPAAKDVDLKKKLIAERDGIFNWALAGLSRLLALKEIPLGGSESKQVHERFSVSNDPLGTFVATRCRLDPQGHVTKNRFRQALIEFCEENAVPCKDDDDWLFRQLWNRYPELKQGQITQGGIRVRVIKGLVVA